MNTRPTDAIDKLNMSLMNLPVKYNEEDFPTRAEYLAYKEGHKDARHAAVEVVFEHAEDSQHNISQALDEAISICKRNRDWQSVDGIRALQRSIDSHNTIQTSEE